MTNMKRNQWHFGGSLASNLLSVHLHVLSYVLYLCVFMGGSKCNTCLSLYVFLVLFVGSFSFCWSIYLVFLFCLILFGLSLILFILFHCFVINVMIYSNNIRCTNNSSCFCSKWACGLHFYHFKVQKASFR